MPDETENDDLVMTLVAAVLERAPGEREGYLRAACQGSDTLFETIWQRVRWEERMGNFLLEPLIPREELEHSFHPGEILSGWFRIVREVAHGGIGFVYEALDQRLNRQSAMKHARPGYRQRLAPGARLGSYEILSLAGAGGMGEVYKAKDTRLDRTVAIKILPPELATDPQFRERFAREARVISQLDHPHICALYDVGDQDGTEYLVMPYLEGVTLAERLTKGVLPLDQTFRIAIDVAEALDSAHRTGIVHRDLKPGNIFLTQSGVKLLDFGLAKPSRPAIAGSGALPATPPNLTAQGTLLGTVRYMAPEQLEGQDADARTDVFAFGAVLYEMLTGKKAFECKRQASLVVAIMHAEPAPLATVQPLTPPALEHLVSRCLARTADERWQTMRDVRYELQWIDANRSTLTSRPTFAPNRVRLAWLLMVAAVFAVLGASTMALFDRLSHRSESQQADVRRFTIVPPERATFGGGPYSAPSPALSPDGRHLVFRAQQRGGPYRLWLRSLDGLEAQALPGTEEGNFPFWSPDSRVVGFFASGKLKKVDVLGGLVQTIGEAPAGEGATWNRENVILFAPTASGGLLRVSAAGGQTTPVTRLEPSEHEASHRWPEFLPDGRRFLFLVRPGNEVRVGSLASPETKRLFTADSRVLYAAPGYLLFVRGGTLLAQAFDADRAVPRGDALPLAERVRNNPNLGRAALTASQNGMLAYRTGFGIITQLTWFDRSGKPLQSLGEPGPYYGVDLSPNEARAVSVRFEADAGRRDLWLMDTATAVTSRLTFGPLRNARPAW
jgi:serine/threonine protein kinase